MKSAGKARNNGLYRHIRTSKEIIRNLLNDSCYGYNFTQRKIFSAVIAYKNKAESNAACIAFSLVFAV